MEKKAAEGVDAISVSVYDANCISTLGYDILKGTKINIVGVLVIPIVVILSQRLQSEV